MDIHDNIFDEMDLPFANSNEDLETISNNHFKPLFDVTKFEIRSENLRDKGIDFHIEIKKANAKKEIIFLNFRFAIQLKATDSKKKNKDGSISLQLDTSNINYLLNNPMPAFYVLYFKETNTFYFESINDFAKTLYDKDSNWNQQQSHVLRFTKTLDANGLEEMYKQTLKKGKFQRILNEKAVGQSVSVKKGDKILIDEDFNITDDKEIRRLIEGIGLEIINEGKWKEIIFLHKKASGNVASTSKYNLVLGIANYYSGNLIDALSFFRAALNLKSELTEDLENLLIFFETIVKYSVGLISDEEYERKMRQLENVDNIGLYIRLEKAKRNYIEFSDGNSDERYDKYVTEINSIINDPKANNNIKLNAKCELILFEGYKKNMDYVKSTSLINALEYQTGPSFELRRNALLELKSTNENWYKNVHTLKTEALESKNYFAYYMATINEIKVLYEFEVFVGKVFVIKELPGVPKPEASNRIPFFDRILESITNAHNYFYQIGHIENTIVALSTKYEILHFLNRHEEAINIMTGIETIIEAYDLNEQRKKLEILKSNGTTHQNFQSWTEELHDEKSAKKNEYEEMRREMIRMDEEEKAIDNKSNKGNLHIHLFPIGYFQFPKKEKNTVYEILNLTEDIKIIFDEMFGNVIPIANIYYTIVNLEGFAEGKLADKGIESWRNIYRIRKAFYENKFYRFDPNARIK